jgi:hypothetical protein
MRHLDGATCFICCLLSPLAKLAECFAENLNTLDRLVCREKNLVLLIILIENATHNTFPKLTCITYSVINNVCWQ